ncbi:hypothetical protein LguiA_007212 [Lonicera macranthoides]
MSKLRLLEIHYTCIPEGPYFLPDELWWIDWDKYPSNSLPTMFEAYILVGLQLRHSRLNQLWEGRTLNLTDCNLLAIPGDLGSLFSLEELRLGGNNFENLPSLNRLSQLAHIELNRCGMLRELPALPSRIRRLFANDCASLRVSADRFAMCKIGYVWFQNCRKLLYNGGDEILAMMILQQKLQGSMKHFRGIPEKIILPGSVIPAWFCNHTFTEHSVLLKFSPNSKFKGYSFFVILEVKNKDKSCNFRIGDGETNHHEDLRWSDLRHDGLIADFGAKLWFTEPGHHHSICYPSIYLMDTDNIVGLEHTIIGYLPFFICHGCIDCHWEELGEIEVDIRSLSPDTVVVKKWGSLDARVICGRGTEAVDDTLPLALLLPLLGAIS